MAAFLAPGLSSASQTAGVAVTSNSKTSFAVRFGFTVTELLVVIAIIAILAALRESVTRFNALVVAAAGRPCYRVLRWQKS